MKPKATRILSVILSLLLTASVLCACKNSDIPGPDTSSTSEATEHVPSETTGPSNTTPDNGGATPGTDNNNGAGDNNPVISSTVGLEYQKNEDDASYTVISIGTATDKDIIIPSTYEGLPVTAIGEEAFMQCTDITSVTIPDSVTFIDSLAFYGCTALRGITIPASVTSIMSGGVFGACTNLSSIQVAEGNPVFHASGNCLIETELNALIEGCKNSVIPTDGSVKIIYEAAFYDCSGLKSITIPEGITEIHFLAFYGCSGLESITLPDSVTRIAEYAFDGCSSLSIYAEAAEKPSGWASNWNPSDRPVGWGYGSNS